MSSRQNRKPRHPLGNDILAIDAAMRSPMPAPGVFEVIVDHDDWCQKLAGQGPCNCDPIVNRKRLTPVINDHVNS